MTRSSYVPAESRRAEDGPPAGSAPTASAASSGSGTCASGLPFWINSSTACGAGTPADRVHGEEEADLLGRLADVLAEIRVDAGRP